MTLRFNLETRRALIEARQLARSQERKMNHKTLEKVSFSKFFPDTQSFVVVKGMAKGLDDFWMQLDIGDGVEKASFNITEYNRKQSVEMLKAMQKAIQESLEFFESAMSLPPLYTEKSTTSLSQFFKDLEVEPVKKAPTKKKKTAAKK
jgi:hypothetical protein